MFEAAMAFPRILFVACCVLFGLAESYKSNLFKPCKKCDDECIKESAQLVYQSIARGIPSLGIQSAEPIYQPEISGHLDKLNFNFTDSTISGFSSCHINKIKVDWYDSLFKMELLCEHLTFIGKYFIHGDLLDLNVKEKGHYKILIPKYKIGINTEIEKVKGSDGEMRMLLQDTTMTTYGHAEEKITTYLDNCKDSKELENILNTHWKQASELLGGPFVDANMKLFLTKANHFLETVGLEDLFL